MANPKVSHLRAKLKDGSIDTIFDVYDENALHQTINNLTTSTTGNPLDAAQGPVINSRITSEVSRATSAENALSARMDTFASLPAGSTSGNAELVDIRVGFDGKTYSNAGTAVRTQVSDLKNSLLRNEYVNGLHFIEGGYISISTGLINNGPARFYTEFIPCAENSTVKYVAENNHANIAGIAFYDVNKNYISGVANNGTLGNESVVTSPARTAYCRASTKSNIIEQSYVSVPNGSLSALVDKAIEINEVKYVSPSGSDSVGDGSRSQPYKTVNKALASGAAKIMVKQGTYNQTIDFSNTRRAHVTIVSSDPTKKAIFVHPDSFVTNSETSVTGYSKVYSCNYTGTIRSEIRLFQDGVPDAGTLIGDEERNPYQRGQEYRCLDTKIIECSANNLYDALSEIENSSEYKYYHDVANGVLYFSRPQEVSEDYPIMRSVHAVNFLNNQSRELELTLRGIECKYMRFYVGGMVARLEDCKASNVFGAGGFVYDGGLSTEFVRCEANGTYYAGGAGDGFNAHASATGDAFSKQLTARLIDCWSHDSMDDGYSDHERSETEIWGGLFEYNGKGGITPSYGSHCSCYNVLSRNNYSGFIYVGGATQDEGGKYGQMLCVMCVAENNTEALSGYGFGVKTDNNLAKLINCKAIGNNVGYYCTENTTMELIDCGAIDNGIEKDGAGTFAIKNTALVTG